MKHSLHVGYSPDNFIRSFCTLHPYRRNKNINRRKPPTGNIQDIPDYSPRRRCDHPNPAGKKGDWFFMRRVKKPLDLKAGFKLFKCLLEGTQSLWFHNFHNQLVLTTRMIHSQSSTANNAHPLFQIKL